MKKFVLTLIFTLLFATACGIEQNMSEDLSDPDLGPSIDDSGAIEIDGMKYEDPDEIDYKESIDNGNGLTSHRWKDISFDMPSDWGLNASMEFGLLILGEDSIDSDAPDVPLVINMVKDGDEEFTKSEAEKRYAQETGVDPELEARYFEENVGGEDVYFNEYKRIEDPDNPESKWWWVTRIYFEKDGKYVELVLNNDKFESRKDDLEVFIESLEFGE